MHVLRSVDYLLALALVEVKGGDIWEVREARDAQGSLATVAINFMSSFASPSTSPRRRTCDWNSSTPLTWSLS